MTRDYRRRIRKAERRLNVEPDRDNHVREPLRVQFVAPDGTVIEEIELGGTRPAEG